MAEYGDFLTLPSPIASGDLSAKQYHFVRYAAADVVYLASSAGELGNCGVLINAPQNGEHATVAYQGAAKVVVGSAVSAGDLLMSTSGGTATTAASGYCALGRALTAGSPGETISCMVFPVVQLSR